jgi:hypothetical protein
MAKKNILIVTGTGGIYGTGHFQRMLALAFHLNGTGLFSVKIFLKQNQFPPDISSEFLLTESIPEQTDLIITDMRDSLEDEMLFLKEYAPVLAIDDSGPGNNIADYTLTLLPVPSGSNKPVIPDTSKFLYGYNFSKGVESLSVRNFDERNIDITVYAGNNPLPELVTEIKKSIPESANSLLLTGNEPELLTGKISFSGTGYAEILCRTKIMVTHFGLTMFEADICGCRIAALNPSTYHSTLSEMMKDEFRLLFSQEYNSFSPERLYEIIDTALKNFTDKKISVNYIVKKIHQNMDNFTAYLKQITR